MPELPEVETTRRGLIGAVVGATVTGVTVRERRLRWPVPAKLAHTLTGHAVRALQRRGKYLIWHFDHGFLLSHLGMSGSLTAYSAAALPAPVRHDHIDLMFDRDSVVRYHDPRRFGAMLWVAGPHLDHPLLDSLGPEPLSDAFSGAHLFLASRGKTVAVKNFVMDAKVVVGVGNIYASESLFHAGIDPRKSAGRVSAPRYEALANAIRATLKKAICAGGSSLRNYVSADGSPGYFQLATLCYDREGLPCRVCKSPIRAIRQGQRSTFFCTRCQK
ncbi:MAG: bifunctional DNA-formamidopyrimidine glycosylase/DNA-(apurinic or apyrimidinic site) lyase [Betaproteobacteria bacterium]|nr:bifunctional DNA-formamidopyrimidine glycosylase/DNA-(apurinic or apyrimidinic site) lyase [Betaproteobacteria bacterium]